MTDEFAAKAQEIKTKAEKELSGVFGIRSPTVQTVVSLVHSYIDELTASLREAASRDEWQPIDGYPSLGEHRPGLPDPRPPVLVTRVPFTGHHAPIAVARKRNRGWITGKSQNLLWFKPTHYRPLPSPPDAKEQDQ